MSAIARFGLAPKVPCGNFAGVIAAVWSATTLTGKMLAIALLVVVVALIVVAARSWGVHYWAIATAGVALVGALAVVELRRHARAAINRSSHAAEIAASLDRLAQLHALGKLTDAEFDTAKRDVLGLH